MQTATISKPFYEFPVKKESEIQINKSYEGPPLSTIYPQFFGQTHLTTDCVCRCLWLLFTLSNNPRSTYKYVPYEEFHERLVWLDVGGLYLFDAFRILRFYGFQHRICIPTETGSYLVAAPIGGRHHCTIYSNGTFYDSGKQFPIQMTLGELKTLISSQPGEMSNMITIAEIL